MESKKEIIEKIKGGLIVSCQAKETDPQYLEDYTLQMAKAAIWGGAAGLRLDTPKDIKKIKEVSIIPIIGLWKVFNENYEVFITPGMKYVRECIEAGADIIAVDGTNRLVSEGKYAYEIIKEIKEEFPEVPILADIRNVEDANIALEAGADMIAPTLCRFDKNYKSTSKPDFELLCKLVQLCDEKKIGKVIMESKVSTPEEAIISLYHGAYSVVVGNAITRPHITTQKFCDAINGYKEKRSLFYWENK
ncbi:N-acetylmannosamine-6-phosphate 2-epimerase [Clostridium paraputrificum]|uniref:N-acetylmannosamine-6-phosphate 2-epimerase n=1 Tax=Clostridium paraputrificum TaxID=29363 RepID=UPI003D33C0DB